MDYIKLFTIIATASLAGCASNPETTTMVQPIEAAPKVEMIEAGSAEALTHLGLVHQEFCRSDISQPMVSVHTMMNKIKAQSAALGADKMVFKQCTEIQNDSNCMTMMVCEGDAYRS